MNELPPKEDVVVASKLRGFETLEGWVGAFARSVATIGVLGMLAAAGVTVADVVLRWAFNAPIRAGNEILSLAFAVAVAATIPAGVADGVNIQVDILSRWLKGRVAAWLGVIGAACLFVFLGLLAWQIARYAAGLAADGRTTLLLGIPQAPFLYTTASLIGISSVLQAFAVIKAMYRALNYGSQGLESSLFVTGFVLFCGVGFALFVVYALFDFDRLGKVAQGHVGWTIAGAFVAMWIMMLLMVPLASVLGLVGIFGAALFVGFKGSLGAFATEATGFLMNPQIATLPLFLLMGSFASAAGLSEDMYRLAHSCLSRFRGGLALATIGGCAGFGALTGSSLATAATIGRVALPEMAARGYSPALSTGCCAAGGTLGALVPPGSGPLVVFALLTEASVGKLFVGSVGPAVIAIIFYFLTVWVYVRVSPASAPSRAAPDPGELRLALKRSIPTAALFLVVMGGLFLGIFTDTESAAVGAVAAFLFALLRGKIDRKTFVDVMVETTATTAMIYGLIFGAQIFSILVGVSALTEAASSFVAGLHWSPIAIITVLLIGYLLLGSFMEAFTVMVITVPVLTPLVTSLGYDVVWWGVIMLCVVETGLIHPPLGLNLYVLKALQPTVPLSAIFIGAAPFVVADLIKLVLLVLFPSLTLWLVYQMSG